LALFGAGALACEAHYQKLWFCNLEVPQELLRHWGNMAFELENRLRSYWVLFSPMLPGMCIVTG
jgi:hypothetical protein